MSFIYYFWHNLSKLVRYSEYLSMFFHLGLTNTQHGRNISLVHWIGSRYADSQVDFYDRDLPLKDNMLQYCCKDMTEVGKTIRQRLSDTFASLHEKMDFHRCQGLGKTVVNVTFAEICTHLCLSRICPPWQCS